MDCLFIHGNYPAQFRHLAPLLSKSGNRVVFLTAREEAKKHASENIEIRIYKNHRNTDKNTHHYLKCTEESIIQGQAVLREINKLREEGFMPKFVVTHAGNGLGLFIKDILPNSIHIGYFEWYFRPETTKYLTKDYNMDTRLMTGLRNIPILQEMERCDYAVVPTGWQKSQFPVEYHKKLNVIFDGIDRSFFYPKGKEEIESKEDLIIRNRDTGEKFRIPSESNVISYATRGMETLRGFPEFMRALPYLIKKDKQLYVVIAGADRRAYSYDAPSHKGSWKEHLLDELKGHINLERIVFTGLLTYEDYRSVLWRSNLHCYFTRPYVTSWSLFEAIACGAKLAVNKSSATSEIAKANTITWVNIDNQQQLNEELEQALYKTEKFAELEDGYDLSTSMHKWQNLLNKALSSNKQEYNNR